MNCVNPLDFPPYLIRFSLPPLTVLPLHSAISFLVLTCILLTLFVHWRIYAFPPLDCQPVKVGTTSVLFASAVYTLYLKGDEHSINTWWAKAQNKVATMEIGRRGQIWELKYRIDRIWWLRELLWGKRCGLGREKTELPRGPDLGDIKLQLACVGWVWVGGVRWAQLERKGMEWHEVIENEFPSGNSPHRHNSPALLLFQGCLAFATP